MSSSHRSSCKLPALVAAMLGVALAGSAVAQPRDNSANQFGDRQSGQWGDPAQGYFGNPAAGEFDRAQLKAPPPGTRPLGRVSNGKAPISPYISLPPPADAAPEPATAAPQAKPGNKKPVSKK